MGDASVTQNNKRKLNKKMRAAIEQHLEIDNGDFRSLSIVHRCKLGCCINSYHSKLKLWSAMQGTLFALMIGIPSESHWLELSEPALLILLWFLCHRIGIRALRLAQGSKKQHETNAVNEHPVLPHDDPRLYSRDQRVRNKRSGEWLDDDSTCGDLLSSAIVFAPSRHLLYYLFLVSAEASAMQDHAHGGPLVDFANMEFSPAAILINTYSTMLTTDGHWFMLIHLMGSFSPSLLRRALGDVKTICQWLSDFLLLSMAVRRCLFASVVPFLLAGN